MIDGVLRVAGHLGEKTADELDQDEEDLLWTFNDARYREVGRSSSIGKMDPRLRSH
jgi:hypothetical protein